MSNTPQRITRVDVEERARRMETEEQQARAEYAERAAKTSARASWIASGGDVRAFDAAWPKLRSEMLRKRTIEREERAKQQQTAFIHNQF